MNKIIIIDNYHHKNHSFLNYYCTKYFILTTNIEEADIVLSAYTYIQIENYPANINCSGEKMYIPVDTVP